MIDIDRLYFEWLLKRLESDVEDSALGLAKLCWLFYHIAFDRRVGLDINRALDGLELRRQFAVDYEDADISPRVTNGLLVDDSCTWLEMLVALSIQIDYLYDGGVRERFLEICHNAGFSNILLADGEHNEHEVIQVERTLDNINNSRFEFNGSGGLFPLTKPGHPDQREVEIWAQADAYFSERLEGVLWTSTN